MSVRFNVGREAGYLVIRDTEDGGRSIAAILPNERKPDEPLNIAGVCAEALNAAWEEHKGKKG